MVTILCMFVTIIQSEYCLCFSDDWWGSRVLPNEVLTQQACQRSEGWTVSQDRAGLHSPSLTAWPTVSVCLSLCTIHLCLPDLSLSAWLSVTVSLSLCTLLLCLPDTFSLSFSLTLSSACSISCLLNVSFYASTLSVCLTLSLSAWLNVPPSTLTHCPSPIPPRPDHRFCVSVPVAWRIERRGCYPHHKLHVNVWVNWCIESTLCAHLDVVLLAGT